MTVSLLAKLFLGAITYALSHYAFFQYTSSMLGKPFLSKWHLLSTYILNFGLFMLMTMLSLHLFINWALICLLYIIEIGILYRDNIWLTASTAVDGSTIGLATNIFTRCITAILLNRPLSQFDNNLYIDGNIKIYPVSIAFVLAAFLYLNEPKKKQFERGKIVFQDPLGTKFLLLLKSILYMFLLLNLFAYYTDGNYLGMKLWGIKSTIFIIFSSNVAQYYISRLSQVRLFQQKVKADQNDLLFQKQESERIHYLAFTDMLTGCYNRAYIEEVLSELEETDCNVTLCFLDLDNLKHVNDTRGHLEGDHYLRLAAQLMRECIDNTQDILFRYGGDEFVILYKNTNYDSIVRYMTTLQDRLSSYSNTDAYPYELSVSYGIARRNEAKNLHEVLKIADNRMYQNKRAHMACSKLFL